MNRAILAFFRNEVQERKRHFVHFVFVVRHDAS
jgi:hypothetical protein